MRLIDADKLKANIPTKMTRVLGEEYEDTQYKYETIKAINTEPTVEAIPIDYIKEQIEMYDGLSDIRDDRWGDIYHTFSQVLRGLIAHWRKDCDRN